MYAWQQVKVNAGDHQDKAGLVLRVKGADDANQVVTVKLDTEPEPVNFAASELTVLGGA